MNEIIDAVDLVVDVLKEVEHVAEEVVKRKNIIRKLVCKVLCIFKLSICSKTVDDVKYEETTDIKKTVPQMTWV
jgi:hypothetical protein